MVKDTSWWRWKNWLCSPEEVKQSKGWGFLERQRRFMSTCCFPFSFLQPSLLGFSNRVLLMSFLVVPISYLCSDEWVSGIPRWCWWGLQVFQNVVVICFFVEFCGIFVMFSGVVKCWSKGCMLMIVARDGCHVHDRSMIRIWLARPWGEWGRSWTSWRACKMKWWTYFCKWC